MRASVSGVWTDGLDDVVFGRAGNDTIQIQSTDFNYLDGGAGTDTLSVGFDLDLTSIRNDLLQDFEIINFNGLNLTLNSADIIGMTEGFNAMTGEANSMVVIGNPQVPMNLSFAGEAGWDNGVTGQSIVGDQGPNSYTVYTRNNDDVKVYVQEAGQLP